MILVAIFYGLLLFYLPGIVVVVLDEIAKFPKGWSLFSRFVKMHFIGIVATLIGCNIMSHESLLGEEYINSLFRSADNYDIQIVRLLPTLIASVPVALILSWVWWLLFFNKRVKRIFKRKILKDPTYTEFSKHMPTYIKLNDIKFVSIWDKEYGQQVTGKIERCEEEGEMLTFLLSNAVIYNSVGEEVLKAESHRLVRRKDNLLVAFTGESPLPGGRLKIQLDE